MPPVLAYARVPEVDLLAAYDEHCGRLGLISVNLGSAARTFLRHHNIAQQDIDTVWTAIALHTTPGIPVHMHPVVALVTAGVEMDVLGLAYETFSDEERDAVVRAFPRTPNFKEDIIQAFYDGIKHKPETTFGNVKADVLARARSSASLSLTRSPFCAPSDVEIAMTRGIARPRACGQAMTRTVAVLTKACPLSPDNHQ